MPLDSAVESAIEEVVAQMEQSSKVSKRMISWLQDMSERDLTMDSEVEHLEALKAAISVPTTEAI